MRRDITREEFGNLLRNLEKYIHVRFHEVEAITDMNDNVIAGRIGDFYFEEVE